jgi:eukaryotic-like serine/threonine-protein kinase
MSTRLGAPGGFGTVYLGNGSDGKEVAIKILHAVGDDGLRELEFANALTGRVTKHVIPIVDCGIDGATSSACIVMEKAEKTLREFISEHGAIESQDTAAIIRQIILGLLEAGDWVHRDLKPENILLREDRWQVADFGIARQADASTSSHTLRRFLSPPYAAPEQWNGVRAEHQTDVRSSDTACASLAKTTSRMPSIQHMLLGLSKIVVSPNAMGNLTECLDKDGR